MKIGIIIQARINSTRLQGKVLKKIKGRTVLSHIISRVKQSKLADEIIIATSTKNENDVIEEESKKNGAKIYRGSENNVLKRYYECAKENKLDVVVRITSDCPLIDPYIIDELINFFKENEYDLVTNAGTDLKNRTYPRGLDVEVFSMESLEEAKENGIKQFEKEHVTQYMYNNNKKVYFYKQKDDDSKYRLTLDTKEDLELVIEIYNRLYEGEHNFYLKEIKELFKKDRSLININKDIKQKKVVIDK